MFKLSAKHALVCAVLPLGLFTAGCSLSSPGLGEEGLHNVTAGNWAAAKVNFTQDYQQYRAEPIAVFNMGVTHTHDGERDQAASLYSEVAARGKLEYADISIESEGKGVSVAQHACTRLHRDNRLDVNCGDTIVARAEVVAPVRAQEPAVMAQATEAPRAPKQDRH